ncbi:hypothetical protein LMF32_00245 [Desemzia sp. C1]|uniref:hypothetical protein n=1 Tax=Desemzia sp. C1 TaxID=2892016 RepID=UPI001E6098F0|nr:hypothetical protein [Desemzia sp. C1]MCI3027564.1 hypothetical protein [Desemzia sp. C1]
MKRTGRKKNGERKNNVMCALDKKMIPYNIITYDSRDGRIDGIFVVQKIGKDPQLVYKKLVTQGNSGNIYVSVIPVESELDLKKLQK